MSTDKFFRTKIQQTLRIDRAVALVWQSAPGWTIASMMLVVIRGTLPLVLLYLMKLVVDAVVTGIAAPDKHVAFAHVAVRIMLTGVVSLGSALCQSLADLVSQIQAQAITDHVQEILHAKSIAVDLEYYENAQYYDTLHRAQQEAPYRPTQILNSLIQLGQSSISLFAIAALLLSFHWGMFAILIFAALPGILLRVRHAGQMYNWQRQQTPTERQSWYINWILTGDMHAKEIRLFDLGALFIRRFRDLRRQLRREKLKMVTKRAIIEFVTQTSATLAVFGSYAFVAYRTIQGRITLGDLVMYYQAFQRGQGFLRESLSSLAGLYEDNLFLSSLYEFLDLKRKIVEPVHPRKVPRPMQAGIVFTHVSFQYPLSTKNALEDINLTIRPGEKIALVGENGAGKTTLIKLLCRLYDPSSGSLTLDGIDLRDVETTALRREISVILQDYACYHLTARDNIWFGNITIPSADQDQIITAARYAGADEVIAGLKHGYETILGKWFEDGEELSVGEWQKVALARAFLRHTQIIVLDEPTSAMDAKAEYEIFQQFRQRTKGQTVIVISHRFSTVRMADRIYVLQHGKIVESGSHDELIRLGGTYAHLFETQAQYYR
jgi:ATP-binding cassette subfamily B protein